MQPAKFPQAQLMSQKLLKGESALATMLAITLDDPRPINSAAPGLPVEIGPIVAKALESFDGKTGKIEVLITMR